MKAELNLFICLLLCRLVAGADDVEHPFEYMLINGAAIFLAGLLMAQVAFVSERWLLFASMPLIIAGAAFLLVDYGLRGKETIKFLRAHADPTKTRPWLDIASLVNWPQ